MIAEELKLGNGVKLTATHLKLLNLLLPGKPIAVDAIMKHLDEQCSLDAARMHISNLRTKLRTGGSMLTVIYEEGTYRLVTYGRHG